MSLDGFIGLLIMGCTATGCITFAGLTGLALYIAQREPDEGDDDDPRAAP